MIDERDISARHPGLELETLRDWIEQGLLQPHETAEGLRFDDADAARVALICDLQHGMGVHADTLPIVLSLIDQLHSTRHSLRALTTAVNEQPDDVRLSISSRTRIVLSRRRGG